MPLLQLLRQHSVLPVHESPLTLQNGVELHTVPSQEPVQQGRPETQAAPSATQVASPFPPSVPPSESSPPPSGSEPPSFGKPTDPLQSQAPNESSIPEAANRTNALERSIWRDSFIFRAVESAAPCALFAHESSAPRRRQLAVGAGSPKVRRCCGRHTSTRIARIQ